MAKRARPTYLTQIIDAIIKGIGSPDQKIDEEKRDIACLGECFILSLCSYNQLSSRSLQQCPRTACQWKLPSSRLLTAPM